MSFKFNVEPGEMENYDVKVARLAAAIAANPEASKDFEGWRFLNLGEKPKPTDRYWFHGNGPWATLGQGIDKIDRNHHPMCRRIEKAWHEL